jgi:hypothetical protein
MGGEAKDGGRRNKSAGRRAREEQHIDLLIGSKERRGILQYIGNRDGFSERISGARGIGRKHWLCD